MANPLVIRASISRYLVTGLHPSRLYGKRRSRLTAKTALLITKLLLVACGLLFASLFLRAYALAPGESPAQPLLWDNFNSRVWTAGVENPADIRFLKREWISDAGRKVFHIKYTPDASADSNFLLAFTNLMSPEPFTGVTEIRFEMKWDRPPAFAFVKLEAKKLNRPFEGAGESNLFSPASVPVKTGGYQQYRVAVQDGGDLSRLVFVFDRVNGGESDIYIDNLRFVRQGKEFVWETFDNPSRFWVPSGAWVSWAGAGSNPPLEMISAVDNFSGGPSGALYLRWDAANGRGDQKTQSAEIKTEGNTLEAIDSGQPPPGLNQDFSKFDRVSAEVLCTNENPIGIFFGHFAQGTASIDKGFITPTVKIEKQGTAQKINWSIPWPPGFPSNDVDVVSFVVGDIRKMGLERGELRIDDVTFSAAASPVSDPQHAVWNLNHFDGVDPKVGFLAGNSGEFSSDGSLTESAVQVTTDTTRSANTDGKPGASLKFNVDLSQVDFAGEFISLFGHTAFPEDYNIDLTQFSQIQFKLMSDANNAQPLRLKVEIKDYRDSSDFTAYRYITVTPSEGKWQTVVLDANVANREQWFFNRFAPDPKRAKLLVIVAEKFFNPASFAFNLDEVRLIHASDVSFALPKIKNKKKSDGLDPLLEHIERKAWLHFDRWVVNGSPSNPDLYLFLDRSNFPDLISTASAGFGLSAICVAHRRGWISDDEATSRVLRVLKTYADGHVVDDPATSRESIDRSIGVRGWFWHFLDRDGKRKTKNLGGELLFEKDKSELSSVDTAILLWGALAAKAYFNSTDKEINPLSPGPRAIEIANLVDKIYSRIDFPFFLRKSGAKANQMYLAWKPESVAEGGSLYAIPASGDGSGQAGFFSGTPDSPATWDYYTDEVLMILLLGVNSPNPAFRLDPAVLRSFKIETGSFTNSEGERVGPIIRSFFGSGFTYFFQQCFLKLDSEFTDLVGPDYFENAQKAARANWLYCRDRNLATFKGNVFGLTAAEGRAGQYHGEWGAPPRASGAPTNDGTIAVYGPASFIAIWPDKFRDRERVIARNPSMNALVTLYAEGRIFDESIGFGDALNLVLDERGLPFYNMATFGIDNGPMLMMIENERSGLFWRLGLLKPKR
jgi:hypothetical protein